MYFYVHVYVYAYVDVHYLKPALLHRLALVIPFFLSSLRLSVLPPPPLPETSSPTYCTHASCTMCMFV